MDTTLVHRAIQASVTEQRIWYNKRVTNQPWKNKMNTYLVGFNKHSGKDGKRTIKARNREEALAKCAKLVDNSFWHFIREVK